MAEDEEEEETAFGLVSEAARVLGLCAQVTRSQERALPATDIALANHQLLSTLVGEVSALRAENSRLGGQVLELVSVVRMVADAAVARGDGGVVAAAGQPGRNGVGGGRRRSTRQRGGGGGGEGAAVVERESSELTEL